MGEGKGDEERSNFAAVNEMKSIGSAAVIVGRDGKILLVKHAYGALNWELPGGAAEADESPIETAVREVKEETLPHPANAEIAECNF